jgi:hypothetical protein
VSEVDRHGLVWGAPKTHAARSVPVPRFLVDELAEFIAGRDPDALVFTGPRSGGVLRVGVSVGAGSTPRRPRSDLSACSHTS